MLGSGGVALGAVAVSGALVVVGPLEVDVGGTGAAGIGDAISAALVAGLVVGATVSGGARGLAGMDGVLLGATSGATEPSVAAGTFTSGALGVEGTAGATGAALTGGAAG